MSVNKPKFPNWDGTTPNRSSRLVDKSPDFEDWDQMTAEVLVQQAAMVEIKTGTYLGDDVNGRTIVTGLTKVIKFLWVLCEDTVSPGSSFYCFKTNTMSGRTVVLPAVTASSMTTVDGAAFVGSDFDVRNDDLALNTLNADIVYHWMAIGF